MKKIGFLLLALILSTSFLAAQDKKKAPKAEFVAGTHDFGKINESAGIVKYVFKFKNTGDAPLIVQRVQPSCGCTASDYTKEPILPGKEGSITVTFNPAGYNGAFDKKLTVFTNVPNEVYYLTVKGEVLLK
ncbi:DUF1573 domain-containing protein [Dysgonomonas sp. 25]|uniref:DUF1573 domain-containing protein n=1 Tax=Dysgonomonas sp. 25 TaxID=2302933 RepID=UPI0013D24391|nr:DUF1573 domain-containing protein [Dysgonomonas sp. 25]NDV67624.1 DUF1573 domain-containing protein [Dysgonomonas sp. 25]